MKTFPAITSTLSPKHLGEFVIEKYGFKENTQCKVLKIGVNHTYIVENNANKYVLRIYNINWRTVEEIKAELDLLILLKNNKISVAYPIQDKASKYIQTLNAPEGKRYVVLFSYAEGKSILNPKEAHCYTLGLEMAKMHLVTVNQSIKRIDYNANTLVKWALDKIEDTFSATFKPVDYIRKADAIIASQFKEADASQLRHGAIHLDLWYENMKIKNDSAITFFDFDCCGNGWLFLDIAYSIMLIFRNEPDKTIFKKKMDALLKGYESITPITNEEKRLLPYGGLAIWLHYSGIHAQRFNDFSSIFFNENFLNYWVNTVDTWMKFNNIKI